MDDMTHSYMCVKIGQRAEAQPKKVRKDYQLLHSHARSKANGLGIISPSPFLLSQLIETNITPYVHRKIVLTVNDTNFNCKIRKMG